MVSLSLVSGTAVGAAVLGPWAVGAQDGSTTTTTAPEAPPAPDAGDAPDLERFEQRHRDHLSGALQGLVDDGTLTEAQRDAVIEALSAARPDGPGHPFGKNGEGLPGGFLGNGDALTGVLGVTEAELRESLLDGQSIADVATARGVPVQTVVDALVAEAGERVDEAVTAGRLTEAEAEERKADLAERIAELVNGEFMGRGPMHPRGR
jgi:hypothetical protein